MAVDYDVAIIGGGPIGSTLAYRVAKEGYDVCILEKKKEIGIPLQCAGIVSKKLRDFNEIPEELILNKAKGAYLHSANHILTVEKEEPEAFIIDRVAYDQFLSKRATDAGVKLFNQYKAQYIDCEKGIIKCQNNQEISARVIVGADGSKSFVSNLFNEDFNYFNASQYLVEIGTNEKNNNNNNNEIGNSTDFKHKTSLVDVFAISEILPGFLWCIPTSKNNYRIGLFSNNSYKDQKKILNDFLSNDNRFKDCKIVEKYNGKIPIFDKDKKLSHGRVILIGDAASQLKPTTGGGLIMGFDTCDIARDTIIEFLNNSANNNSNNNNNNNNNTNNSNNGSNNNKSDDNDDLNILKKYEKNFKKKYSKELSYQIKVQQTLESLSDDDLDYMFVKLKEKNAEEIISKYGDMDKQSILVKEFIKRGFIFSILPKIFFRKLTKIWGF